MFYKIEIKDHIRIEPKYFDMSLEEAMVGRIKEKYDGFISKELGIIVDVLKVNEIGQGVIIPGDGAQYYEVSFELLTFEPEMQETLLGNIKDIADFGVFMSIGPIEGMIHISQTMDDYVSFTKEKVLQGKEKKRVLKVSDQCRAKMIAISYKDIANPKFGLTMRQQGLGKTEWLEEDMAGKAKAAAKAE